MVTVNIAIHIRIINANVKNEVKGFATKIKVDNVVKKTIGYKNIPKESHFFSFQA